MLSRQFLLLYTPFILFSPIILSDITADREALLRLSAAVRGRTIQWNTTSATPCLWRGVICDLTINRVVELRLPGAGLSGQLPLNTIGGLTALRVVSLRSNSLNGQLPVDIGSSTDLASLFLQDNEFSGEIPPGFFGLSNLLRVNISRNNFSGEISPGFRNLTKLRTLYLDNNQFSGSIRELNSLLGLTQLNVSFNRLNGSIPSNFVNFSPQSFLGNSLCGAPLQSCPDAGNNLSGGAIAGIVIGSVIGLSFLILIILFFLCAKCKPRKTSPQGQISPLPPPTPMKQSGHDDTRGSEPIGDATERTRARAKANDITNDGMVFFGSTDDVFNLDALLRASAEVLGRGSIGTTYRAYLEGGNEVIVKRLKYVSLPERQFREKVEILGSLAHENLVPIKAYFYNKDEKLLVFESMPLMASLDAILQGGLDENRAALTWKITSGAASGIEYLHSLGPDISHGNIKPSNILLTNNFNVRVTDYGLIQLVSSASTPTLIAYRAPELLSLGDSSQEGDVYSFGVVLLELLTGKSPSNMFSSEGVSNLGSWARSIMANEMSIAEVFSHELVRHGQPDGRIVRLFRLSLNCMSNEPHRRPSMMEVVRYIKEISW